jgi:hypothetical protein
VLLLDVYIRNYGSGAIATIFESLLCRPYFPIDRHACKFTSLNKQIADVVCSVRPSVGSFRERENKNPELLQSCAKDASSFLTQFIILARMRVGV